MPALLAGLALSALIALGGIVFYLRSRLVQATTSYLHFRCPSCRQKVRYLLAKRGRQAMCPRCRRQWQLPVNPEFSAAGAGYFPARK